MPTALTHRIPPVNICSPVPFQAYLGVNRPGECSLPPGAALSSAAYRLCSLGHGSQSLSASVSPFVKCGQLEGLVLMIAVGCNGLANGILY